MKKVFLLTTLLMFSLDLVLASQVEIEIENGTNQDVTIMIGMVQGVDALPRSYRPYFQLKASGEEAQKTYKNEDIKKGTTIFIYAQLSKGGKTKAQEFHINNRKFTDKMLLLITQEEINDEESVNDILAKFKDFSKINNKYHESIDIGKDEAFKSVFGSMIITDRDSNIIMRITAKSLNSDRNDYQYTGQDFSIQKDFTKEAIVKLNGNVPLAADLSFMFGNSEISSFAWSVKNAGFIPWSHPDGKTEIDLFYSNLDSLTLNYLADLYIKDSTINLFFIDRAYIIESYNIKSYAFKKLNTDAEINVTIYGSGSSNYVRSNETTIEVVKTNIMTDIWGSDQTDLLRQNSKNKLDRLKQEAMFAKDKESLIPIYNLLKEYNSKSIELPEGNFSKFKIETLENIETIEAQIKIK